MHRDISHNHNNTCKTFFYNKQFVIVKHRLPNNGKKIIISIIVSVQGRKRTHVVAFVTRRKGQHRVSLSLRRDC